MARKDPTIKDIHIMCDADTHRKIKMLSVENNLTMSEFALRAMLNKKIEARLTEQEKKMLLNLIQLGNNTNQISKRLNSLQTDRITIAMAEGIVYKINSLLNEINYRPQTNKS